MGKNLKGKEIGDGLCQRSDGRYMARFTGVSGKKYSKYFKELADAKIWLEEERHKDKHGGYNIGGDMKVDDWFTCWMEDIMVPKCTKNTILSYYCRYKQNIKEIIGNMKLTDVKTIHCQKILNVMSEKMYAESSIKYTKLIMSSMFDAAVDNLLISFNPCRQSIACKSKKATKIVEALTIDEQRILMQQLKRYSYYNHYAFILQTGLRVGELCGLRWQDVNFEKRTVSVNQTMKYSPDDTRIIMGPPKSKAGIRTIPLTNEAYKILLEEKEKRKHSKVASLKWKEYVFLGNHGTPVCSQMYDEFIVTSCKRGNIRPVSIHVLRHTFATRCIEAGMKPKTLQKIMGHANIATTMNMYVSVTDSEKDKEMSKFESYLENMA